MYSPPSNLPYLPAPNPRTPPRPTRSHLPSSPLAAWCYRLSAPPEVPASARFALRERVRRGRLASLILLALLVVVALSLPDVVLVPTLTPSIAFVAVCCLVAIPLNRSGRVTAAAILLLTAVDGALAGALLTSPEGLDPLFLPVYYLLVTSELIAVSLLPPRAVFWVAAVHSLAILLDVRYQAHTMMWEQMITTPGILYSLVIGPIALQFVVAVVSYLWVQSSQSALRRADRAEEIAELERREAERTFALEEGVRYLHQILAAWAQGEVGRRVPPMPVAALEQVRFDLNTFIERFAPVRRLAPRPSVLHGQQPIA